MISFRQELAGSWVKSVPSMRELARLLAMPSASSLRALIERLRQVEPVELRKDVVTPDGFPLAAC